MIMRHALMRRTTGLHLKTELHVLLYPQSIYKNLQQGFFNYMKISCTVKDRKLLNVSWWFIK